MHRHELSMNHYIKNSGEEIMSKVSEHGHGLSTKHICKTEATKAVNK